MTPDCLPDAAGTDGVSEWSYHHRVLYRCILGVPGARTADVQLLYEAIAPLAYEGTTSSPVERRWRRECLADLREADVVAAFETPRGWVWVPEAADVDDDRPGRAAPAGGDTGR